MKYVLILALIFLIGCSSEEITTMAVVSRVVDGDTVELNDSQRVRLVCINTPEKNEPGYVEATNFLKETVLNRTVLLVKDVTENDKYGRLLRYVYLEDGTFVNLLIAEKGYGEAFPYAPDTKFCSEIKAAEDKAKSDKTGLWSEIEDELEKIEENLEENLQSDCVNLGCPKGTSAVGSKNSDKWHYCNCRWAKRIKAENLVCFKTTKEAESKGYVESQTC